MKTLKMVKFCRSNFFFTEVLPLHRRLWKTLSLNGDFLQEGRTGGRVHRCGTGGTVADAGQEGGKCVGWWENPQQHEIQAPGTDILLRCL